MRQIAGASRSCFPVTTRLIDSGHRFLNLLPPIKGGLSLAKEKSGELLSAFLDVSFDEFFGVLFENAVNFIENVTHLLFEFLRVRGLFRLFWDRRFFLF